MKKKFIFLVLNICFLLCAVMFLPVDFAMYEQKLSNNMDSYYIVEWDQVTGASWKIVGDQDGYYDTHIYVDVKDKLPVISRKIHLASGDNKYICQGTLVGESEINDIYIYDFDSWDILYPISRNSLLDFLPKNYVCLLDLIL